MRLIDADALAARVRSLKAKIASPAAGFVDEDSYECGAVDALSDALRYIKEQAESAVPIVRCRACKYFSGAKDLPGDVTAIGYCDHPSHYIMPVNAGFFCADGKKKTAEVPDA